LASRKCASAIDPKSGLLVTFQLDGMGLTVSNIDHLRNRFFTEVGAGGFTRVDGTVAFYTRVNALVTPEMTIVDLGAGRGKFSADPVLFRRGLRTFRGRVREVIGLDVDGAVSANPTVDSWRLIPADGRFPLDDSSVELILSDFTFEHVVRPDLFCHEIDRILRPGGWVCARTPNKWGSIAVPARLVPNSLHEGVLRFVQPTKESRDTFPTAYRLNTSRDLLRYFKPSRYSHFSYAHDSEPTYAGASAAAWSFAMLASSMTPRPLKSMLFIFLQKREADV